MVFVLGSGRSGTTWLADAVNHDESYRYIYEPLHPENAMADCPFDELAPVPPEPEHQKYKRFFDRIVTGKVHSLPANRFSTTRFTRKTLIKCIRANLATKWLSETYPRVKIILLIRNPFAVTASRLRTNWGWQRHHQLLVQPANLKFFTKQQQAYLTSTKLTLPEIYLASWCIENILPLKLLQPDRGVQVAWFENLLTDPEPNFRQLSGYLGDRFKPSMLAKIDLPSRTTSRQSASGQAFLDDWRSELDGAAFERLQRAGKLFDINQLYPDDVMPNPAAFQKIIVSRT